MRIGVIRPLIQIRPYPGHVGDFPYGIIRVGMIEIPPIHSTGGDGGGEAVQIVIGIGDGLGGICVLNFYFFSYISPPFLAPVPP